MSRDALAMQYVLDLLTDGILTSTTRQIGFTDHDKIRAHQFPFVQCFSDAREDPANDNRQSPGTSEFVVQIIDVAGQSGALRTVLDNLADAIRLDVSLHGLVRSAAVTVGAVRESGEDEHSVAAATVTVEYDATIPNFTPFAGGFADATQWAASGTNAKRQSLDVANAVEVQKLQVIAVITLEFDGTFPVDLTPMPRYFHVLYYVDEPNKLSGGVVNGISATFTDSAAATTSFSGPTTWKHGWNRVIFDTLNPTSGGATDYSDLTRIALGMNFIGANFFTSSTYGIKFLEFGYDPREFGANGSAGVDSGF